MSMTTDITGGLFGPSKEELAAQARMGAARSQAEGLVEAARAREASPAYGPGSKKLGRPGYYPTGDKPGRAEMHLAAAAARGKELGEPTSFRGGAGAPEPVHIMRGTTSTYGYGPEEYATPLQAQQAYNRRMLTQTLGDIAARSDREKLTRPGLVEAAHARYGTWRPAGQTLEEVKQEEGPGATEMRQAQAEYYRAGARTIDQQSPKKETASPEVTGFLNEILAKHGRAVPKQNAPGYDYEWPTDRGMVDDINRALDIAKKQGVEAARKDFEESRQFHDFEPLFSPEMREAGKKNPEFWRRYVLEKGPELRKRLDEENERLRQERENLLIP